LGGDRLVCVCFDATTTRSATAKSRRPVGVYMSGDRSLDEFVPDGRESDDEPGEQDDGRASDESTVDDAGGDESGEREAGGGVGGESGAEEADVVAPAESTYAWAPSGATCDACGASVERRWRDEGDLVCADCKSW
jgi:hypothetical protein